MPKPQSLSLSPSVAAGLRLAQQAAVLADHSNFDET